MPNLYSLTRLLIEVRLPERLARIHIKFDIAIELNIAESDKVSFGGVLSCCNEPADWTFTVGVAATCCCFNERICASASGCPFSH